MRVRIAFWYALALLLLAYYVLFELTPPGSSGQGETGARNLIDAAPEDVLELYVRNERGSGRFKRAGAQWQAVKPAARPIPPDLIDAIVANLTSGQRAVVVAEEAADLKSFGLAHPKAEIRVTIRGRSQPVTLLLGDKIPTGTAVYGRIEGSSTIYKVGANIDYYQAQLLFAPGQAANGACAGSADCG